MNKPRSVLELMRPGKSGMGELMARAEGLRRLDTMLAQTLAPELANRVRAARLEHGLLTLVASSASIATRVRLDAPELLRVLHAKGAGKLEKLKVKVAPLPPGPQPGREPRALSTAAREALGRFAADQGDTELLARLSGQTDSEKTG